MRLGVFGGSFNPLHMGHIQIALAAMEEAGLSRMLLMVAADPPHKAIAGGVSAKERLEMARLAVREYPSLIASDLELNRPGKSYTVDTVAQLKAENPGAEVYWLIGADMLLSLDTWYDPRRLLATTRFLVAGRPDNPGVEQAAQRLRQEYGADITLLKAMGPDISSSDIRARVEKGLPIEGYTCEPIIQYIYENGLYLPDELRAMVMRLQGELSPKRFKHTAGVVRSAAILAQRHGLDPAKARLAAYLHDCAKEDTAGLARKYGLHVEGIFEPVRHAPVGAAHARYAYGVTDEAVLQAIALHTVCGSGMTELDKAIYLADKIEPGRNYAAKQGIYSAAERSLNEGMLLCIAQTEAYLEKNGERMHPATITAREEIRNQQKGGNQLEETMKEKALGICKILDDKKAVDIKALYVADKTIIAEWFVVCSGRSSVQVKTLCDELEDRAHELGLAVRRKEGYNEARWIVLDFGDILVHIFHPEEREYYNLERLWEDGGCIDYSKEYGHD